MEQSCDILDYSDIRMVYAQPQHLYLYLYTRQILTNICEYQDGKIGNAPIGLRHEHISTIAKCVKSTGERVVAVYWKEK